MFGANLGDFAFHVLHLDHVRGLPGPGACFHDRAAGRAMLRRGWRLRWNAIVTLRTAATSLANLTTHGLGLGCGVIALLTELCLLSTTRGWSRRQIVGERPNKDLGVEQ